MATPIETMQDWYATVDLDRLLADEVEFEIAPGFPEAGIYRSRKEVAAMFARLLTLFKEWSLRVDRMLSEADTVVAVGAYVGATNADRTFEVPFCHVWTVREGRIAKVRHIPNAWLMQQAIGSNEAASSAVDEVT